MAELVLVGLGSNLHGPITQLEKAFQALNELEKTRLLKRSSLYSSTPQGPQDQEDFCNAAALLETRLPAKELLLALQAIEQASGRVKTRHWGERVIDLDILFYGQHDIRLEEPSLQIPHPYACQRDFVLEPILEICPDWQLPDGTPLATWRDNIPSHQLKRITSP